MTKRYALLVGIGRCTTDVAFFAEVLKPYGFAVHALTNEAATLSKIQGRLIDVQARAKPEDVIALFYAGHLEPKPGVPAGEGLAVFASPESPRPMLAYAQLLRWVDGLPCEVVVVLDTSHARQMTSAQLNGRTVWMAGSVDSAAACFTTEDGVQYGAFSYFLGRAIKEASATATYDQVYQQATASVASRFPSQRGCIAGASDRSLFGGNDVPSLDEPQIVGRSNDEVTINIGAAARVTVRSLWAAYTASHKKCALIEITSVRPSDATARVLSEGSDSPGPAIDGLRIEEEEHDYGDMRLRVAIEVDSTQQHSELHQHLTTAELLQLVPPSEVHHVVIRSLPAASVQHAPQWTIEQQGRAILPARAMTEPSGLRIDLEKLARHRNALSLVNPNPRSLLAGKVDLILQRREGAGWQDLPIDPQSGLHVLHEHDRICLEIRNDHSAAIFVNVFDFGLLRAISALSPDNEGWTVRPGERVQIGDSQGIRMYFPRGFEGNAGIETIKLFAAGCPIEWSALLAQEGLRGITNRTDRTELPALLDFALTGRGTRRRPVRIPPDQEWISVQRTFELRRG